MIKFYDTCALLSNAEEIFKKEEYFYISSITLRELEHIKNSDYKSEEIKFRARIVLNLKTKYEKQCRVISPPVGWKYRRLLSKFSLEDINDSKIILTFYKKFRKNKNVIFVTTDSSFYHNALTMNLRVEPLKSENIDEYAGFLEWSPTEEELAKFYSFDKPNNNNLFNLFSNQYLLIKDENNEIVDYYRWNAANGYVKVNYLEAESRAFGKIKAYQRDPYQLIALDSLFNNKITMLRGAAGTGKSYLSLGYLFHLLEKNKISKIIIFCNTVAAKGAAKLGFYPGDKYEKLLDAQIGNFLKSKIGDVCMVEKYLDEGVIELIPMADIRGYDTTNMNAGIYITEAQNLDIELMRLALQRIGEDCICILDGDSKAQVDLSIYAGANNGMKRVSEVFRGEDFYGEVTLQNIYRSRIAEIAQKM